MRWGMGWGSNLYRLQLRISHGCTQPVSVNLVHTTSLTHAWLIHMCRTDEPTFRCVADHFTQLMGIKSKVLHMYQKHKWKWSCFTAASTEESKFRSGIKKKQKKLTCSASSTSLLCIDQKHLAFLLPTINVWWFLIFWCTKRRVWLKKKEEKYRVLRSQYYQAREVLLYVERRLLLGTYIQTYIPLECSKGFGGGGVNWADWIKKTQIKKSEFLAALQQDGWNKNKILKIFHVNKARFGVVSKFVFEMENGSSITDWSYGCPSAISGLWNKSALPNTVPVFPCALSKRLQK